MLKIFFIALLLFSHLVEAAKPIEEQRLIFLQTENLIAAHASEKALALSKEITTYPLSPSVFYKHILNNIQTIPASNVDSFLQQFPNTLLAEKLQKAWFHELVRQGKISEAEKYYKTTYSIKEQCLYLGALWKSGHFSDMKLKLTPLWLVGHTQPKECNALFTQWKKSGQLNSQLIWERFNLALLKNDFSLAKHLSDELPAAEKSKAMMLMHLQRSPELLDSLDISQYKNLLNNVTIVQILSRYAKKNPQMAYQLWKKLDSQLHFTLQEQQNIATQIGFGFAKDKNPAQLQEYIQHLKKQYISHALMEVQIRQELAQQNWPSVQKSIENLPDELKRRPIWVYWYARSLDQQQHSAEAVKQYQRLVNIRNYYGFLAALHLHKPFPIHDVALQYSPQEYQKVNNLPGIQRAKELYSLNRPEEANAEWWYTVKKMNDKDRYIAANLAKNLQWDNLSLSTAITSSHQDDLKLRFPLLHQKAVADAATEHKLSPALLLALIRQESFFRSQVVSYAGARGLMQLMPTTAAYIADLIHMKKPTAEHLFDPQTNIQLGSAYLSKLLLEAGGHPVVAIASYNAGPTRVRQWLPQTKNVPADIWIETIPYLETRNYVKFITTYALIYQYVMQQPVTFKSFFENIQPPTVPLS